MKKRSAKHVIHALSHLPRRVRVGELLELKSILRRHGYPTRHALSLHREGMGPEELSHRIRSTVPGEWGSLEYTHNIHKR